MEERRFALIIATDQYEDKGLRQLVSPVHDEEALAQALRDTTIGNFNVQTLINMSSSFPARYVFANNNFTGYMQKPCQFKLCLWRLLFAQPRRLRYGVEFPVHQAF